MMGVSMAMIFSSVGAGYGTALAGMGISGMGQYKPELIMKSLIPGKRNRVTTPPRGSSPLRSLGPTRPSLGYSKN
jgi:hypothetical protein